jgi:hypothetical protein
MNRPGMGNVQCPVCGAICPRAAAAGQTPGPKVPAVKPAAPDRPAKKAGEVTKPDRPAKKDQPRPRRGQSSPEKDEG